MEGKLTNEGGHGKGPETDFCGSHCDIEQVVGDNGGQPQQN